MRAISARTWDGNDYVGDVLDGWELTRLLGQGGWGQVFRAERDGHLRALKVLHWFIDVTTQRRYEILDRQLFPGGFVQQHILHAAGRNGGSIALRVCIVIKVGVSPSSQAPISRIDEYFDPAEIAPLMG